MDPMPGLTWLSWRIVPGLPDLGLPTEIRTRAAALAEDNMPDEVGMLLPSGTDSEHLIEHVTRPPHPARPPMVGLFLADPFLYIPVESRRLQAAGIRWISNLPSVAQQDEEFAVQLADVGLDAVREFDALARFRAAGFRVAATVVDADGARAAAAITAEAVIILPRVADFVAGFPSLRQREVAVQGVSRALREAHWSGALLGLAEERDTESRGLWPQGLDGLVIRPERRHAGDDGGRP